MALRDELHGGSEFVAERQDAGDGKRGLLPRQFSSEAWLSAEAMEFDACPKCFSREV